MASPEEEGGGGGGGTSAGDESIRGTDEGAPFFSREVPSAKGYLFCESPAGGEKTAPGEVAIGRSLPSSPWSSPNSAASQSRSPKNEFSENSFFFLQI